MHPVFAPSDLLSWDLLRDTFRRDFVWTLTSEVAVFLLVLLGHQRTKGRWTIRDRRFRLDSIHRQVAPGLWILPIYVWAYEAHLKMLDVLGMYSAGLVTPPFSWVVLGLYQIFFAVGCLVVVQTLLVATTGGQASSLGVEGKARAAAVAALLVVSMDVLLYLSIVRWFEKEVAGAL